MSAYTAAVRNEIAASRAARSPEHAELIALQGARLARIEAAARVRILRGGYRGDLATVTGPGMAGGVTVTTDSGVPLAFAERDIERLEA